MTPIIELLRLWRLIDGAWMPALPPPPRDDRDQEDDDDDPEINLSQGQEAEGVE